MQTANASWARPTLQGWSAEWKRITRILHEDEKAAAKADAIWAELEEREGKA